MNALWTRASITRAHIHVYGLHWFISQRSIITNRLQIWIQWRSFCAPHQMALRVENRANGIVIQLFLITNSKIEQWKICPQWLALKRSGISYEQRHAHTHTYERTQMGMSTGFVIMSNNAGSLASFPCKLNTFTKRVKNVVTGKGIQVGIECKYVKWCEV
jgi:hypothetical protein